MSLARVIDQEGTVRVCATSRTTALRLVEEVDRLHGGRVRWTKPPQWDADATLWVAEGRRTVLKLVKGGRAS